MPNDPITSLSLEQLEALVTERYGQPRFRAKQLHEWLHAKNAHSYDEMTNLPKALRERLAEDFPLQESHILQVQESDDGTRKYLLQLSDGAVVECVGILDGGGERLTVCVSTQVGCAMNCSFCATGQQGLARNLSADEIVEQVVAVSRDFDMRASNVVLMGQGEPFQNYDAVMQAMRRMNNDPGIDIGARHITVSTSGLCEGIRQFAKEPEQFRLAVSLHSAVQDTRNALMPRLSGQNLKMLKSALSYYCDVKGRRVTFEYMLIEGVNDTEDDLQALIGFCDGFNSHVNLLPFNAVPGTGYAPSPASTVNHWKVALENAGIPVSVRKSKGSDIAGACGQLITHL